MYLQISAHSIKSMSHICSGTHSCWLRLGKDCSFGAYYSISCFLNDSNVSCLIYQSRQRDDWDVLRLPPLPTLEDAPALQTLGLWRVFVTKKLGWRAPQSPPSQCHEEQLLTTDPMTEPCSTIALDPSTQYKQSRLLSSWRGLREEEEEGWQAGQGGWRQTKLLRASAPPRFQRKDQGLTRAEKTRIKENEEIAETSGLFMS